MRARYFGPVALALALAGCNEAPMGLPGFAKAEKPAPVAGGAASTEPSSVVAAGASASGSASESDSDRESASESASESATAGESANAAADALTRSEAQTADAGETGGREAGPGPSAVFGLLRGVLGGGDGAEARVGSDTERATRVPRLAEAGVGSGDVGSGEVDPAEVGAGESVGDGSLRIARGDQADELATLASSTADADRAGAMPTSQAAAPVRRAGLFGLLGLAGGEAAGGAAAKTQAVFAPGQGQTARVQTASLTTGQIQEAGDTGSGQAASGQAASGQERSGISSDGGAALPDMVEPAKRRGLLGGLFSGRAGATSAADVSGTGTGKMVAVEPEAQPSEPSLSPGAPLAFGTVGRVCHVSRSQRGKQVDRFPKKPRAGGYALYDSAPGSTGMRSFYITGFKDGCARMVTAANVVFGAPSTYERLRYGLPSETLRKSATEAAYTRLKSRVCNVRRNQPCGPAITKLERDTVFVTLYDTFEGSRTWSNVLLHGGDVYARDMPRRR